MSLLIIDFDDTLVDTSSHFERAFADFAALMEGLGHSGPQARAALAEAQKRYVDAGWVQHADHLAHLMVEVAQEMRYNPHIGFPVPGRSIDAILVTGRRAYADRAVPFAGVCEALHDLLDAGHALLLYTRGELQAQQRRVERSGLHGYFQHAMIVPHKSTAVFRELVAWSAQVYGVPQGDMILIGDSVKHDILPALELGVRAIRVGTTRWTHLDAAAVDEGAYTQVATFVDAANLILGRGAHAPAPEAQEAAVA